MRVEGWLFLGCAIFFGVADIFYWNLSHDPTGSTALALSVGLAFLVGFYLLFTGRRLPERPEDNPQAEIEQGTGELGFFSPHSWWPLFVGLSGALAAVGVAIGWWLFLMGMLAVVLSVIGFVFEYYRGHYAHCGEAADVDVYEALYTTRAMRRVRPDPIPESVQARILDSAVRAPSGGNSQNWRFLLVDSPDVKAKLGPLYRECAALLWSGPYAERIEHARANPDHPASASLLKVTRSAQYLADHFEEVPLFLFAFTRSDPSGGSIFPAVWSAQLAARAEGVGSALTTILGNFRNAETMQILGVPAERGWEMACCVSFGYPTGRWGVAPRRPAHEVAYRNAWGNDLGIEIPDPLWAPEA